MALLIPSLTLIPLLGAVLIGMTPNRMADFIRQIASSAVFLCLAIVIYICTQYDSASSGYQFRFFIPWLTELGIAYHTGVDGIGCCMILLHSLCSFSAILVSYSIKERVKEYFIFMLVLISSIFGVFTSIDLFFTYLFYEMAVIPMYPLIVIWGSKDREYAAMKLTIYITLGAVLAFVGLIGIYRLSGLNSFDLIVLKEHFAVNPLPESFQNWCAPLLILGFGVIASLWPLHSWSPIGYAAAPSAVSMLHAGVLKKIGIYLIIRIVLDLMPEGAHRWLPYVSWLAVINVLYGAWAAMAQKDLKFVIGFASVSHMGYALLGISAGSETALTGVVFFMLAHGLMAALCFALIGWIYDQAHTRSIDDFGGIAKQIPFTAVLFLMAALASSGLPGFANFVSEILIFFGCWASRRWQSVLAIFGIVVTATYMLRLMRRVFYGAFNQRWVKLQDPKSFLQALPFGVLLAALFVFGVFPSLVLNKIRPSINQISLTHQPLAAQS